MKLYDLGIIANSDNLINGSYGIIIEDFSPTYYRKFDFWKGTRGRYKIYTYKKKLRAVTNQEEEFQVKFQKYIEENEWKNLLKADKVLVSTYIKSLNSIYFSNFI